MSNRRSSGVLCLGPKHGEGLMDVLKGARPSCGCQHLCRHVHRCLGLTIKPLCSVPSSTSCFSPPNASPPSMHTKLFTSFTSLFVARSKVLPGALGRRLVSLAGLILTCRKEGQEVGGGWTCCSHRSSALLSEDEAHFSSLLAFVPVWSREEDFVSETQASGSNNH